MQYLTLKALRYGSHSVTCKLHRTSLYLVSIHQMAHPQTEVADMASAYGTPLDGATVKVVITTVNKT